MAALALVAPTVFCVECGDQPPSLACHVCKESFCRPCFDQQHHRGKRQKHAHEVILGELLAQPLGGTAMASSVQQAPPQKETPTTEATPTTETTEATPKASTAATDTPVAPTDVALQSQTDAPANMDTGNSSGGVEVKADNGNSGNGNNDIDSTGADAVGAGAGAGAGGAGGAGMFQCIKEFVTSLSPARIFQSTKKGPGDSTDSSMTSSTSSSYEFENRGATGSSLSSSSSHITQSRSSLLHPYFEAYDNIPLRLSTQERDLLRVLEGALSVSEYTDNVDVLYRWDKSDSIEKGLREALDALVGLQCSADLRSGQALLRDEDGNNEEIFHRRLFEIGRRYKTMNPDKMRGTYGKMMYMLQDSVGTDHRLVTPILTISSFLKERNGSALLHDSNLKSATTEIHGAIAEIVRTQTEARETATKALIDAHASPTLTSDDIMLVLQSIRDSNSYQNSCAQPVQRMLYYLTELYTHDERNSAASLRISYGDDGSKLTHSHSTHFTYVLQSLTLWLNITQQMFGLWMAADLDLLSRNDYRLYNTGQGLNRVQACPNVSRAMHGILGRVQSACGSWVGLSVVHLGDRDVPNALMFIDKYTQLPRILGPLATLMDHLEDYEKDPHTASCIAQHGGAAKLRVQILTDFFRYAFNGDGDDGGSCIDGRLTSTWNWCSRIGKKPFYDVFLLGGFQGFDGSFRA